MNRIMTAVVAGGLAAMSAQGALVTYNLSGTGSGGTVASGTFSFDTDVIGADYSNTEALDVLTSFSVTLSSIPGGGPASTTFAKGVNTPADIFVISTDSNGVLTDVIPGFQENADGYSLSPSFLNTGLLRWSNVGGVDNVTWSYSAVPEVGPMAVATGLGLIGFMTFRRRSKRG